MKAEALRQLGMPERRSPSWRRPCASGPTTRSSGTRAERAQQAEAYEEAVACYDRALSLEPRYAASWSDRGMALGTLKRLEESIESLERAIALRPEASPPWLNKALAEEQANRASTRRIPSGCSSSGPRPTSGCRRRWRRIAWPSLSRFSERACARRRGPPIPTPGCESRRRSARAGWTRPWRSSSRRWPGPMPTPPTGPTSASAGAVSAAPTRRWLLTTVPSPWIPATWPRSPTRASLLRQGGGRDGEEPALDLLMRAAAIEPGNPEVWINLAISYAAVGVHKLAVDACDKALGLRPSDAEVLEMKADSLGRLKQPQDSLAAAEQALALEPQRAHAWYLKANALARLSRKEDGLAAYDRCIALDPREGERLLQQGLRALRAPALSRHPGAVRASRSASSAILLGRRPPRPRPRRDGSSRRGAGRIRPGPRHRRQRTRGLHPQGPAAPEAEALRRGRGRVRPCPGPRTQGPPPPPEQGGVPRRGGAARRGGHGVAALLDVRARE